MKKIQKAAGLPVDCIIMDIEDGVAYNQKEAARSTILEALQTVEFGTNEKLVRVNRVGSGLTAGDLIHTVPGKPDGFVIPKVEHADHVKYVHNLLNDLEAAHGIKSGTFTLHAIIETATGLWNAREIVHASPRLTALQFGAEDLAGDMGLTRTRESKEIFYGRSVVVTAATDGGLQAIDGVYLQIQDTEGAYAEAKEVAGMGFQGKMAIHPSQLEPFHRAFTPSDAEIAAALRLVEAHEAHQAKGVGAFVFEGRMIDPAIVAPAEQVLAKARAAGKL